MSEVDPNSDKPQGASEGPRLGPLQDDRRLTRQDLRRFGTVTAVLVAMFFLAIANKDRRELRRQGEPVDHTRRMMKTAKAGGQKGAIARFKLKLSKEDMLGDDGRALSNPVDMIIRDRENVHQSVHKDAEDQTDTFFTTAKKRAYWRAIMVVDPSVQSAVKMGHPTVMVTVFPHRIDVNLVH